MVDRNVGISFARKDEIEIVPCGLLRVLSRILQSRKTLLVFLAPFVC